MLRRHTTQQFTVMMVHFALVVSDLYASQLHLRDGGVYHCKYELYVYLKFPYHSIMTRAKQAAVTH